MGVPQAFSKFIVLAFALLVAVAVITRDSTRVGAQASEGTVRIMPPISTGPIGNGAFDVYIVLENFHHNGTITYDDNGDGKPDRGVSSDGMGAFEFTLQFDPAIIALDSAEPGPDIGRSGRSYQCLKPRRDEPNTLTFGCLSLGELPAGPQGTLTLATVTVRPLARGSSPLLLEAGLAGPLGDDAPVQSVGAVVRTTGTGRPTIVATGSPEPSVGPGETSTRTTSGGATAAPPTATVNPTGDLQTTALVTMTSLPSGNGNGGNPEAQNGSPSGWSPTLWSLAVVGGVAAIGVLGLAVTLFVRGRRLGF